jgi:hypothetical protein
MEKNDEHTSQRETLPVNRPTSKLLSARNFLLVLATILVLSVAYYFVIALPAHNRLMLQLEREKFQKAQELKEKEELEKRTKEASAKAEAEQRTGVLNLCLNIAEEEYWNYIKLNGSEVKGKKGVYSAPTYVFDMAQKRKKEALDECHRRWDSR